MKFYARVLFVAFVVFLTSFMIAPLFVVSQDTITNEGDVIETSKNYNGYLPLIVEDNLIIAFSDFYDIYYDSQVQNGVTLMSIEPNYLASTSWVFYIDFPQGVWVWDDSYSKYYLCFYLAVSFQESIMEYSYYLETSEGVINGSWFYLRFVFISNYEGGV
jgi:CDP-diglyceride synthetase